MDAFTTAAASGLRARMESLEMLANNLANTGTAGYKSDREFYSLYVAPEASGAGPSPAGTAPLIERHWTDFAQGTINHTGNAAHLALSGSGFFVVNGRQGPLYTRSGDFRLSRDGELQTQDGYAVRAVGGNAIRIDPALPFEVSSEGVVTQAGAEVSRLELTDFDRPQGLTKLGQTYFQWTGAAEDARRAAAQIQQGSLEAANQGPAEAAVRLTSILRQFEMLQRAITIGSEMNRKAVEEVARVG